ncbi:MAG: tRNA uridine-5-carboxymethylaminomethyl(34) synthesis GTPase MnmE [Synergistaceae bacterium]|nr:tRNA uridine-5-carboxymethylaminomethyl(34) synthesis GTPase MnmE [Synergistaceae bacterium]
MSDTIAAISTAWGEAGIAIVRVSGPDTVPLACSVLRFGSSGFPPPREMRLASLLDEEGEACDQVLAVRFISPKSYTGEDMVEIQTHGGSLVARMCLEALTRRGARIAEPGEFTRRAFLNGRMDLSQSEAVLGVIQSRSAEALHAAARSLAGGLSRPVEKIRAELLTLQGNLEVGLDFPEGETALMDDAAFSRALDGVIADLEDLEARCSAGALLREGVSVVIAGRPNVGKSSLLNALLGRDRAIVTDIPGTTRDLIEEPFLLQGIPLRLADTAGLRESNEAVEAMGIERARDAAAAADLCLWVLDGSCPLPQDEGDYLRGLNPSISIIVLNKSDLPRAVSEADLRAAFSGLRLPIVPLSARTGDGLDELKEKIVSLILGGSERGAGLNEGLNVTARQLADVRSCLLAVQEARNAHEEGLGQDLAAGALGRARQALDELLGVAYDDALLDSIFSRFCVGK